ncbi:MAG: PocR ligand-binding domain-containing protein [Candidatus Omnitrophota bacterium]
MTGPERSPQEHDATLVDGKYSIRDLVDIDQLLVIFEKFTRATGFTIGFLDHPGLNILIGTGWKDICTKFHRSCPASLDNCAKSNRHLLDQLTKPGKLVIEACENGLVDCATPIIIKGVHVASLATGQLLLEKPDIKRFKRQALTFGYDERGYLKALKDVQVVSPEKLKNITSFLGELAVVISELGYANLNSKEEAIALEKEIGERKRSESHLRLSSEVLNILNEELALFDTITRILAVIKDELRFDAVGFRLKDGYDFPYFVQNGFSSDFLLTENTLLARDERDGVCRDSHGNISLECTCGLILTGQTDPANPLFTKEGSAWTNDSSLLLDLPPDHDPRLHPRNRCIHDGYRSIALIPIRADQKIVGLLQLNDRGKGRLTLDDIHLLEGISAIIGVALARKKAQDQMRESEDRLRFALEASDTGAWELDLVDNTVVRSLEYDRIFGYREPLPVWTYEIFLEHVVPEDRAIAESALRYAITNKMVLSFECRIRRTDGQTRWIWVIGRSPGDAAGDVRRMVGIVQDITERKKVQEELAKYRYHLEELVKERTNKLEEANKELDAFSYSVSHDLKAPLRALDSFSHILDEEYGDKFDAQGKHILGVISSSARRMGVLIDDLLRFARLNRQEIQVSRIDMRELAQFVLLELKETIPAGRDIDVELRDLPATNGDTTMIRQVWINLLSNAIKFTGLAASARIEIGFVDAREEKIYYVKDNGVGFDMEYVDKLFGVFQRLHAKSEFEGTGVGLAIVQRVIQKHGGRVWAEGKVSGGATFYFALPGGG